MPTQTVSVVIPTYKRPRYLRESIESALRLKGYRLQLIVVSDACELARAVCGDFPKRLIYLEMPSNQGQSACLNTALKHIEGEFFTVLHDDDRVLPNKLIDLVPALEANPKWGAVGSVSDLIHKSGKVSEKNEKRQRRIRQRQPATFVNQRYGNYIQGETVLYRTEAVKSVEGWNDSLPHGEECDLHLSLSLKGWRFGFVDAVTAQYRIHGENKSIDESGMMRESAEAVGKKLRAEYRRDVWANLCSIPERVEGLRDVVLSIAPQVDRLNVMLIGYSATPNFLLKTERVNFVHIPKDRDRGTVEKFLFLDELKSSGGGYFLTVDDDILYPEDYVEELIHGIRSYDGRALCSFHGSIFKRFPVVNYFKNRTCLHFKEDVPRGTKVHLIGNVCGGFDTDAFELRVPGSFSLEHNSDDSAVSIAAQRQGVPAIVLEHPGDWIKPNPKVAHLGGLYDTYSKGHDGIAATINAFDGWLLPTGKEVSA